MIYTNPKKSLRIVNRTKYFIPGKDKTHVTFSSPNTYQSRQIKIEGYESRLYWQFRYCQDHDGQSYFYTLTYNDLHMPKHYGINCFDYEDLRNLLCGGFRKKLLRKYGTYFKYFVGAELGDGKGERGMHNNPHYHIIFFLENANDIRYPYVKISPEDFRYLVKTYWQGFDENRDGFRDYNEARYGIAREGENCGLITDFRACMYCAKYVCKDVKLKQHEDEVIKKLRFENHKKYYKSEITYEMYFKTRIYELYNTPLNAKHTKWSFSDKELIKELNPDAPIEVQYELDLGTFNLKEMALSFTPYVPAILSKYDLWEDYYKFVNEFVDIKVHEGLTEWRNRYCNKCRISQGLGDYALEFIQDKMNPYVQVPNAKKGMKNRPIGMYYYRKLYTDVIKDKKGNYMRVLNDLGIEFKVSRLSKQMKKMADKASSYLQLMLTNEELFEKMRQSDINTNVTYHFSSFKREINKLKENTNIILQKYAEYKLVYEDRYFEFKSTGLDNGNSFPDINVFDDYRKFLVPSVYSISRSDIRLSLFLEDDNKDYLPYYTHPYFLRYRGIFDVLDMCTDYFFVQGDNKAQKEAEERAEVKRFHNKIKVQEFYKNFR